MTALASIHPAVALILAGIVLPCLPATGRRVLAIAAPALAMLLIWQMPAGAQWQMQFMDMTLMPLRMDALSRVFALAMCLMAVAGAVYSLGQNTAQDPASMPGPSGRVEPAAVLVYAGSAVGVTLAGDLFTLFVFWEVMAIGSTLVIWAAGTPQSAQAAQRYLMIHLLGGAVLFAGIAGHVAATGSLAVGPLLSPGQGLGTVPLALILVGYLVNAAAWPLAAWLPDAYPQASISGTVFLSAFTTKTAVYVLMRGYPGTGLLVGLGLVMVLYGVLYALRENDIRRMLAYTLVNQNGLMLVGVGLGGPLALNGVAAQAVTGIVYMGLLMMVAGAVMQATSRRHFSELAALGPLGRHMPWTAAAACVGAASVAALPLTSGFVAKSMVSEAAGSGVDSGLLGLALMAASAVVTLHAGLRLTWMIFFHRPAVRAGAQASELAPQAGPGQAPSDPPSSMRWAMALFAVLCVLPGLWPQGLYALLPHAMDHAPYSLASVGKQMLLLGVGGVLFMVLRGWFARPRAQAPDVDWLWRSAGAAAMAWAGAQITRAMRGLSQAVQAALDSLGESVQRHLGPGAPLARTWTVRGMAMWVMVLMLGYLLLYYL